MAGILIVGDVETRSQLDSVQDGEWLHVRLGPSKWAMVRVSGETIVRRAGKQLGDVEYEVERLKENGEFENES